MRIINGLKKNKKLVWRSDSVTRPMKERIKISIFDIIYENILDAKVLDLFSGTGQLGVECLSRGAKHVSLVDNDSKAIKLIKENCQPFDINKYLIYKNNVIEFLNKNKDLFDLIFIDPPFNNIDISNKCLEVIFSNKLSNKIIIIQILKKNISKIISHINWRQTFYTFNNNVIIIYIFKL